MHSLQQKNEVFHQGFLQSMWPNPQETADLVTLTAEILNGKLHFLCSVRFVPDRYHAKKCVMKLF